MADALDILLGHTEVQRWVMVINGQICNEARIIAVDRHEQVTVYSNWCEPVKVVHDDGERM